MKVRFLGAINGVTGSCTHFKFPKTNTEFLVDCGQHQGERHSDAENHADFPFDPKNIKFIILTHAHIDHCGLIPKLCRDGFKGRVICMAATAKLTKIALFDAVKHVDFFTVDDVKSIKFDNIDDRDDFGLSRLIPLDDDIFIGCFRTSHILGSVSVTISWKIEGGKSREMVLSGDIGNNTKDNPYQSLLAARQTPHNKTRYILTESTYGARVREERYSSTDERLKALADEIEDAFSAGYRLIIPCFSLHRTQEVLFDIRHILQKDEINTDLPLEVLVDSPLAKKFTEVYGEELCRRQKIKPSETIYRNRRMVNQLGVSTEDDVDLIIKELFPRSSDDTQSINIGEHQIRYIDDRALNRAKNRKRIILTGSGMCNGGPIQTYLMKYLSDPYSSILFTGYLAEGTLGSLLEKFINVRDDVSKWGQLAPLFIGDNEIQYSTIRARISNLGPFYSGHADQTGILDYIFKTFATPNKANENENTDLKTTVFINHGNNHARDSLDAAIQERNGQHLDERNIKQVIIPKNTSEWFDLDSGEWETEELSTGNLAEILSEQRRTNQLLESLLNSFSKISRHLEDTVNR